MQEREYFREVCLTIMQKNKTVNFVGVIDNRGKLLYGQSSTKNCITCMKSGEAINSSTSRNALSFCGPKNEASQFFSNCLVPVIKLSTNADRDSTNKAQKDVIPLYNMILPVNRFVKVGIMPLNERKDKFLCVYTDQRDIEIRTLA